MPVDQAAFRIRRAALLIRIEPRNDRTARVWKKSVWRDAPPNPLISFNFEK